MVIFLTAYFHAGKGNFVFLGSYFSPPKFMQQ